jgi:threonine aldolase
VTQNFASDNVAGAAPEILAALSAAAGAGAAPSYGADPWTARVEALLKETFATDLVAHPVATGTAANALALATATPAWGAVYCHAGSHVMMDECGAPEFFAGGAKLVGLDGADGKITAAHLDAALARGGKGVVHHVQPAAVSITQATEAGTTYRPEEVRAIAEVTHRGRRALRQLVGVARLRSGRRHVAGGRRRAQLRRHEERGHGGRGGRLLPR